MPLAWLQYTVPQAVEGPTLAPQMGRHAILSPGLSPVRVRSVMAEVRGRRLA